MKRIPNSPRHADAPDSALCSSPLGLLTADEPCGAHRNFMIHHDHCAAGAAECGGAICHGDAVSTTNECAGAMLT